MAPGETVEQLTGQELVAHRGPGEGPQEGNVEPTRDGVRFSAAYKPHGDPRKLAQGGDMASRFRRSTSR